MPSKLFGLLHQGEGRGGERERERERGGGSGTSRAVRPASSAASRTRPWPVHPRPTSSQCGLDTLGLMSPMTDVHIAYTRCQHSLSDTSPTPASSMRYRVAAYPASRSSIPSVSTP
eukprot:3687239-Rhodomonas_salina.1